VGARWIKGKERGLRNLSKRDPTFFPRHHGQKWRKKPEGHERERTRLKAMRREGERPLSRELTNARSPMDNNLEQTQDSGICVWSPKKPGKNIKKGGGDELKSEMKTGIKHELSSNRI